MTAEDFVRIFYSNSPRAIDWQNIDEITWMYQEGLITVEVETISSHDDFIQKIDFVLEPTNGLIRNGESAGHMALKSLAADFLQSKWHVKDIHYEYNLIGFEVDVIDADLHFPCECGDTNAIKLEKYFEIPTTTVFTILPYAHEQDIKAYLFQVTPRFFEYLLFKQKQYSKKILSIKKS